MAYIEVRLPDSAKPKAHVASTTPPLFLRYTLANNQPDEEVVERLAPSTDTTDATKHHQTYIVE